MAKLTLDDLKKIKQQAAKSISVRDGLANVKITVHMGTCGIAAGARDVMQALMEEMAKTDRHDIQVVTSGCLGMCSSEPNVTVEHQSDPPAVYQHMNPDRIRQVFQRHVLGGQVQREFVLSKR